MALDSDIDLMYEKVIEYLKDKTAYYKDPAAIPKEFNDFNKDFNFNSIVYSIQSRIPNRPTLGEANLIKAYRDLRAAQAEYEMRLMSRADYLNDSELEETDNYDKWSFNKKMISLHMIGKDVGV